MIVKHLCPIHHNEFEPKHMGVIWSFFEFIKMNWDKMFNGYQMFWFKKFIKNLVTNDFLKPKHKSKIEIIK